MTYIDGLALAGYRSFGEKIQYFGPFGKVNLLIGKNNSGKSNFLAYMHEHYRDSVRLTRTNASTSQFKELDKPLGYKGDVHTFGLLVRKDDIIRRVETYLGDISDASQKQMTRDAVDRFFEIEGLATQSNSIWVCYQENYGTQRNKARLSNDMATVATNGQMDNAHWKRLWMALTRKDGGSLTEHWVPETLASLTHHINDETKVELISAFRKVGEIESGRGRDFSGTGLVKRLAELQNPDIRNQHLKADFAKINHFLQTVTGSIDAAIEIPAQQDVIHVVIDGKTLPLTSLGTGIHEVVILAAAGTILKNTVVCLEEPEIHLHPEFQKKLLQYLQESTSNQYFIATHSAHLLNSPDVSIFHVELVGGYSEVEVVTTDRAKSRICHDLGYQPSDILQANCIIWVEGPSDRIYLNYWLHQIDPELVEGTHYSIMFYGGRLLSHLSGDDYQDAVDNFISLRHLNRHASILIDRDTENASEEINETKRRVCIEFEKGPGLPWVTFGREIENYVPVDILTSCILEHFPSAASVPKTGIFDNTMSYVNKDNKVIKIGDKASVARVVVKKSPTIDVYDLKAKLEEMVGFIRVANKWPVP